MTAIDKIKGFLTAKDYAFIKSFVCAVVLVLTILACVEPMADLPLWNGEIPGHRNQYELMAENILEGRISFDYGDDDEALSKLENPYDPEQRKGVTYHWDHAYYEGEYYMYFGIVPVFLAFLPYRVITGEPLTTFKATQAFVAIAIIGIFAICHLLRRLFFKKMPYAVCLALSAAFAVMSVWNSTAEPALYCTAITAAIMLETWSLFFFLLSVWGAKKENIQILLAGIGALLGALAFGCRPPIALANILVIPMLVTFLRQRHFSFKLFWKLLLAASPYFIIGAALMVYNYVRFDSPFEFGQAYQLTVADQSQYRIELSWGNAVKLISGTLNSLFDVRVLSPTFPFLLETGGVFFNFPILLFALCGFNHKVIAKAKENKLGLLLIGFAVTVLVIIGIDILWSPYLLERYHLDIYFLMGIGCFLIVGLWLESTTEKMRRVMSVILVVGAVITVVCAVLLYYVTVKVYYPDIVNDLADKIHSII